MTEKSLGSEIATQTVLPATSLNFPLLRSMNHEASEENSAQMKRNEVILQNQMDALRQFDAELVGTERIEITDEQCDSIESMRMERNTVNSIVFTVIYVRMIWFHW